jgi:hypothetical protein
MFAMNAFGTKIFGPIATQSARFVLGRDINKQDAYHWIGLDARWSHASHRNVK